MEANFFHEFFSVRIGCGRAYHTASSRYPPPVAHHVAAAGVIVFIFPNEPGQVAVTLVIACMFALVFEALAPYDSKWDAWISRSGHVIVLLSIFVAFLLEQEDAEDTTATATATATANTTTSSHDLYGGVLLGINVCMVLAVAVQGVTMACSATRPAEALPRSVSLAAVGFHVRPNRGRAGGPANHAKRSRRLGFGSSSEEADEEGQGQENDNDTESAAAAALERTTRTRRRSTYTDRGKMKKRRRSFRAAVVDFGGIVARTSPRERQARIAPTNSDDDWNG